MAKKAVDGGKINKSKVIREYYEANKKAKPREIAEALKAQGLVLSPQYVSVILSNLRRKGGKVSKRGRKPKAVVAAAAGVAEAPVAVATKGAKRGPKPASAATTDAYAGLVSAKNLVASTGSVENARKALEAFAKLMG